MRLRGHLLWGVAPVWEGEGGGGGGAGAGEFKAPDGMPAEFVGKDAAETLGKLWGGYGVLNTRAEGLRTQLAQVPGPGKSPDEYVFAPDEALKPYFPDVAKDPVIPLAREAFMKAGVPPTAFQPIISEIYSKGIAAGIIQPAYSPAKEMQAYGELNGITDKAQIGQHLEQAEKFATGLARQLQVPEAAKKDVEAALVALTDTAAGNIVLRALHARLTASGINIPLESSSTNQGALTADEARALGADPRIDPANRDHKDPARRFDPELRKRYDAAMAQIGRTDPRYAGKQ